MRSWWCFTQLGGLISVSSKMMLLIDWIYANAAEATPLALLIHCSASAKIAIAGLECAQKNAQRSNSDLDICEDFGLR